MHRFNLVRSLEPEHCTASLCSWEGGGGEEGGVTNKLHPSILTPTLNPKKHIEAWRYTFRIKVQFCIQCTLDVFHLAESVLLTLEKELSCWHTLS